MKISQVIKELEQILADKGDVNVMVGYTAWSGQTIHSRSQFTEVDYMADQAYAVLQGENTFAR